MSLVDLSSLKPGDAMEIIEICGDEKYVGRLKSAGLNIGQKICLLLNEKNRVILGVENSLLAVSLDDSLNIKGKCL